MSALPAPLRARTRLGRWWLGLPLRSKGAVLIMVPLAVTVGVLVAAFALQQRAANLREELRVGTNTLIETSLLTEAVGEADSAVRGYAATGDPALLGPYQSLDATLPTRLRQITTDAPDAHLAGLEETAEAAAGAVDALGRARDGIATAPEDRASAAAILQEEIADVETFLATAAVVRTDLLSDVTDQADESLRLQDLTQWTLMLGLLAVIATSLAGGAIIASSIIDRTVVLSDNIKRFWQGKPLTPVTEAGDEIGQLSASLARVGRLLAENERDLRASRDEALAATAAKDEFLSRVSHELRTPLSAIIGFGQLLQTEELSDDDRESVDHIVRAGHHLLSLINEVLDIARIEAGTVSMSVEPVLVDDVVGEAVAFVRRQADDREISVTVDAPDQLTVEADRQRLEQVVLNLLTNAVKYNRHGGRIAVAATATDPPPGADRDDDDRWVRLSVADTGPGIAPDSLDQLFEPFERLGVDELGIDGTGVGLALSKGLVEAMGGAIGVESTVGTGSTFWVDLPRGDSTRASAPAVAPPSPRATTRGEGPGPLVLYIEDNRANQRLVERVLRDRPERLEMVATGQAGIDAAREHRPQLVLLDLGLPDLDGHEVLGRLKADPGTADIPVVVISADATQRSRDRLYREGAVGYMAKPVQVGDLVDLLDRFAVSAADGPTGERRRTSMRA